MSESDVIDLPKDWAGDDAEYAVVPEGEYHVLVQRVTNEPEGRVKAELQILDEGACAGKRLYASYTLTLPAGKRLFKEFLAAIDVQPDGNRLPVSRCRNKVLEVTVKRNSRDGKVYANVVAHRVSGT